MAQARRSLGTVELPDGRVVTVYRPEYDLWVCLNEIIFRTPKNSKIDPRTILESVVAHCTYPVLRLNRRDLIGLANAIVDSWPEDESPSSWYRSAVKKCVLRQLKTDMEKSRLRDFLLNPPPAMEDSIRRTIEREVSDRLAPSPSQVLSKAIEPKPPLEDPDTPKKLTPCQIDCIAIIRQASKRLTTEGVRQALESHGKVHGNSTIRRALADLVTCGELTSGGKGRRSKGYGLPGWPEGEAPAPP
jgi:hypothetical protein